MVTLAVACSFGAVAWQRRLPPPRGPAAIQLEDDAVNHTEIQAAVDALLRPHGFVVLTKHGPDPDHMGGWFAEFQTGEFRVIVSQDRTGDVVSICIGSRVRPKAGTHMRGPWSLSHLRGYLDGGSDQYIFSRVEDQIAWLCENLSTVLQSSLLNSDKLNQWSVHASRRLFGKK